MGRILTRGFRAFKENIGGFIVANLILEILTSILVFTVPEVAFILIPLLTLTFTLSLYDQMRESGRVNIFSKNLFQYIRIDIILTVLLITIKIFLWTLLFIIPGLIKTFSYSRAIFIKYENPEISPGEAIRESERQMVGKKMSLFLANFVGGILFLLFILFLLVILGGVGYTTFITRSLGMVLTSFGAFFIFIMILLVPQAISSAISTKFQADMEDAYQRNINYEKLY